MDSLIRLGLKTLKLLFGVCIVIGLFFLIVAIAITSVPYFTAEHYEADESPSTMFSVVLETYDESLGQSRFHCARWEDFQQMQRNNSNEYIETTKLTCRDSTSYFETVYSTDLSSTEGPCTDISGDFKVEYVDDNTKIVRLNLSHEAMRWQNSYRLENHSIIPLSSCTVMSSGICVSIFFVSIFLLPTITLIFRYCNKRFGKLFATGFALILAGLFALNYAIFSRRMSLDGVSDNPQDFIAVSNLSSMVAVGFFFCALICSWIRKKKSLPDNVPA